MLAKIEISNFKNFKENFVFDLSNTSSFSFNQECIKNKVINKAIVYGHNGSGKSNLGFAIFDLISHITDKKTEPSYYKNYLNQQQNLCLFLGLFSSAIIFVSKLTPVLITLL